MNEHARALPPLLLLPLGLAAACSSEVTVTVTLATSTSELIDPFRGTTGLRKVRVTVDGSGPYDDVSMDLSGEALASRSVSIGGYPGEGRTSVRAQGFDDLGNLVAYGEVEVELAGDVSVAVPFHRNLAFVAHLEEESQANPAGTIYVVDVASRTFAAKLRLAGARPIAAGVSARGGEGILVAYADGGAGFLGVLTAATGEWAHIPLGQAHDLAVGAPGARLAVAAGGGSLEIIDLDAKAPIASAPLGGTVADGAMSADGSRAIFALRDAGVVVVDLGDQCATSFDAARCLRALDVVESPAGIALATDGRTAFITSAREKVVFAYELDKLRTIALPNGFATPVGPAAYSPEIQAVVAVGEGESGPAPRVMTYVVPGGQAVASSVSPPTLLRPLDIAADASGRRLVVVAAGTSSATAGLTVVETAVNASGQVSVVGGTGLYPTDPDDTFLDGGLVAHQRYRPARVAVLYGR